MAQKKTCLIQDFNWVDYVHTCARSHTNIKQFEWRQTHSENRDEVVPSSESWDKTA